MEVTYIQMVLMTNIENSHVTFLITKSRHQFLNARHDFEN